MFVAFTALKTGFKKCVWLLRGLKKQWNNLHRTLEHHYSIKNWRILFASKRVKYYFTWAINLQHSNMKAVLHCMNWKKLLLHTVGAQELKNTCTYLHACLASRGWFCFYEKLVCKIESLKCEILFGCFIPIFLSLLNYGGPKCSIQIHLVKTVWLIAK